MSHHQGLLIVDVQNDFCRGGAMPIAQAETIIPVINNYIEYFYTRSAAIIATRHWHPATTSHFETFGGLWPSHGIRDTPGALFHPSLTLPRDVLIVSKGMQPDEEGGSAFEGVDSKDKSFLMVLKERKVKELFIAGFATEYCIKATVLDALENNFAVNLLMDAIKGVHIEPEEAEYAVKKMLRKGAKKIVFGDLEK
ncbi:MAG TPA: nicotinamidase [Candidatus Omnitrophica bacterium]|uniref:nicotinamidase n=1 Tax=Candidatus Kaiserbacteria bacterium GW2011_GWA2_49_19 TaxID=1618669 RepID=A0A0G1YRF5_9BACT|nr:MAG: Nicotinamidase [Candidatus Kaiserbacteria bacterium GW2011_GWA2_49_19]HBR15241.1 nicotinamidase [Candidatus Omnitrophota bacterium]